MSFIARAYLTLSLLAAAPVAAQAPPKPLPVTAGAPYRHLNSGLTLPVTLDGLPRNRTAELEAPELDVLANYAVNDESEALTLYVYRSTAGSLPVWFDRAVHSIETRPVYGTPVPVTAATAFAPPGAATASAMIATWGLSGSTYRATGLVIAPLGEWLVKLRYSSKTLDAAAIDARLRRVLTALGWPGTAPSAPAAVPVSACPNALKLSGRAKPVRETGSDALFGALMASLGAPPATSATAVYCRDATPIAVGGVYRPDGDSDRYLIALSDAGRGVIVGPNVADTLPGKKRKPTYAIDFVLPGRTLSYAPQDRLPPPDQVLALLQNEPRSSGTTWGKSSITVDPKIVK